MMNADVNRIIPLTSNDIITDWTYVKTTRSQGHIIVEGGKYLSNQIRGDIYLQDIHGKKQLICNRKNARNSITNIMLTGQFQHVIPMHLRIDKYGYKAEETDITLQQFIDYCKNEGCKLYFRNQDYERKDADRHPFRLQRKDGIQPCALRQHPTEHSGWKRRKDKRYSLCLYPFAKRNREILYSGHPRRSTSKKISI